MSVFDELAHAIEVYERPPLDGHVRTTRERFERFFASHEPLCRTVIAAGIDARRAGVARARIAADTERVKEIIDQLWGGLWDGLSYIGYDEGYFYGGQPWSELCVVRSAVELLEELYDLRDPEMGSEARGIMDTFAHEMFQPLEVPDGMPESHWWWRAAHPPSAPTD